MTAPTTDKSHLLRFGYAPGEYGHGQCVDCEQKFYGNKSARRCETCAESLYAHITSVEAVADKHRAMTTLPEEAVKAADIIQVITDLRSAILQDDDEGLAEHAAPMVKAKELIVKLSASPFLTALEPSAAPCPCTKIQQDETCPVGYPSLLCEICDGKGVVQPSEARKLALEEAARVVKRRINLVPSNTKAFRAYQEACRHILSDLRTLSSPDHADAGKVEGDARADLERFWRPISEADRTITYEDTFNLGDGKSMTIRNSDHFWVRDADGRVYEATWSDHKGGYWWDLEGESRVDPVEYMPHPLSLPSALSEGAE